MGDILLPYHDSFSILSVEIERDLFDLDLKYLDLKVLDLKGDIFAISKVPGDDPDRRDTSIPERRISLNK